MDFKNIIQKSGIEGDDHVTRICQDYTVHQGLPLLPGKRTEFKGSLAFCQHDAAMTGKQQPVSSMDEIFELFAGYVVCPAISFIMN
jgi:hypothetical protein